jgi:hypothetical protein
MELFTVTMSHNNKLFSAPVNQIQGLGEANNKEETGFIQVGGQLVKTIETYSELLRMYQDLTGTGSDS